MRKAQTNLSELVQQGDLLVCDLAHFQGRPGVLEAVTQVFFGMSKNTKSGCGPDSPWVRA